MFETGNCLYVIPPKNLAPFFFIGPSKKPLYIDTISIPEVRDDIYSSSIVGRCYIYPGLAPSVEIQFLYVIMFFMLCIVTLWFQDVIFSHFIILCLIYISQFY